MKRISSHRRRVESRRHHDTTLTQLTRRELATVLAALRFHQTEHLQGSGAISDRAIGDIATDGGALKPLRFREVDRLCERLNLGPKEKTRRGPPTAPRVTVSVFGGVAEVMTKPAAVEVHIFDYDVEGEDLGQLDRDADGQLCRVQKYSADDTVGDEAGEVRTRRRPSR